MKNSKIFDIIKKTGRAFVFNIYGEQWLSDGIAAFSLAGLPKFSEDTLLCMLDKNADGDFPVLMNAKTVINTDAEVQEDDVEADISPVIIKWRKTEYVLVKFGMKQGFFVNFKYIKDFYNSYGYIFKVRQSKKAKCLVVYDGFIPVAMVAPASIINTGFENRIDDIFDVVHIRMEKEARTSATGESVPESDLLGDMYQMAGDAPEQIEM